MTSKSKKNIFFHVGTSKTGTTFLQHRVFPKLKGIYYIQTNKYKRAKSILNKTLFDKYLLSREFDKQLETEIRDFAKTYPDTTPIIVFRKHDAYIASQYRRFIKNGFRGEFVDFFDLQNDSGYFKKKDLNYSHQIKILEKYFTKTPVVLSYEDFKNDPRSFINRLAKTIDIEVELQQINFNRKHTSYSEKQLKAIKFVSKYINIRKRRIFKNGVLHLIWRFCLSSIRYPTLYIAKLIPKNFFSDQALISKKALDDINKYYKNDWESCLLKF